MTREEKELITNPNELFYQISDEYGDMAEKCISDIKHILLLYFPNEDPRFIDAITKLIHTRCNEDVLILVEKLKAAVLKTLEISKIRVGD